MFPWSTTKIALCGSTRFRDDFTAWNRKLGTNGHVVYSLSAFGRQPHDVGKDEDFPVFSENEKIILDLVHLQKIENSETIVVINPGGYIGLSTYREICWASLRCKEIYLTYPKAPITSSEPWIVEAVTKLFRNQQPGDADVLLIGAT